jgi:hypothetical protein
VEDNYAVAEKLHGVQTLYNVCCSVVANTDYCCKVKQTFITVAILLQTVPIALRLQQTLITKAVILLTLIPLAKLQHALLPAVLQWKLFTAAR